MNRTLFQPRSSRTCVLNKICPCIPCSSQRVHSHGQLLILTVKRTLFGWREPGFRLQTSYSIDSLHLQFTYYEYCCCWEKVRLHLRGRGYRSNNIHRKFPAGQRSRLWGHTHKKYVDGCCYSFFFIKKENAYGTYVRIMILTTQHMRIIKNEVRTRAFSFDGDDFNQQRIVCSL